MLRKIIEFITRKDRMIANQEIKIKNRDKLIEDLQRTVVCYKHAIESLELEVEALRTEAYKTVKKPRTKKSATSKKA